VRLEQDARARAVEQIGLDIFAGNEVAHSLYRSSGYGRSRRG
jgi:hypothetical protein